MKKQYLIELPFKGYIQTTIIDGLAIKSNIINGIWVHEKVSVELYQLDYSEQFTLVNDKELNLLFKAHQESFITGAKEVTEDYYFDKLECLPPCKWHKILVGSVFYMAEFYTGNITEFLVSTRDKYYSFMDNCNLTDDEIELKIKGVI